MENAQTLTTKRTSQGIREVLFDELDLLRNGKSNPTRANAVGRLAASIIDSVELEISAHKLLQSHSGAGEPVSLPKPLAL